MRLTVAVQVGYNDSIVPMTAEKPKNAFLQLHPAGLRVRMVFALVALATLLLLLTAVYVQPTPNAGGHQRQLDLPQCSWSQRHLACPTCGMTRAFAFAVRGRLLAALYLQPAGTLAAILCFLVAGYSLYVTLFGKRLDLFVLCFHWRAIALILAAVVLLSWLWRWMVIKYLE